MQTWFDSWGIVEALPGIVYIYELATARIVYLNHVGTRSLEMPTACTATKEENGNSKTPTRFVIHPDDQAAIQAHRQNLQGFSQTEPMQVEYRVQQATGTWLWLRSREVTLPQDWQALQTGITADPPIFVLGIAEDITLLKSAQIEQNQQAECERLVSKIALHIRQSLNLQQILETTVADVRRFLQTDRVIIFQFQKNWSGVVAVESVGAEWAPILGTIIHDPCFAESYIEPYRDGQCRSVGDIYQEQLSECHVDLLQQFQVKANLVLPILQNDTLQGNTLWGLLIAHHCQSPRQWEPLEIELLKNLAAHLAIAIQQSELYHQVQQLNSKLEQQVQQRTKQLQQSLNFAAALKRITDRVRESLDERQILQTAVQELAKVLQIDYCCAALYNTDQTTATVSYEFAAADSLSEGLGQVLQVADTPKVHRQLLQGELFQAYEPRPAISLALPETGDLACPNLFTAFPAKLLCPIVLDLGTVEAPSEVNTELKLPQTNHSTVGYLVIVSQVVRRFNESETKLVKQIASQCAIAIRQARLYQASQKQVQALEKLNSLKNDFLSTVSHELRTPVATMRMAIRMLHMLLKTPADIPFDKVSNYLGILQDQCEREINLINDLLELQSLETSAQPLRQVQIELATWVNRLLQPFEQSFQQRQQTLTVNLADNLPTLLTDAICLERVMSELFTNASKYSPTHALITLKVWAEERSVCLQVANSGAEIPTDELTSVFKKFYRVPNPDPWKQGGTGLGLALVQKLVHHLGGSIRAESSNGQTQFTVLLPYRD